MLNSKEFRENYLRRFKNSRAPIEGIFELTGRCNFNCKMCYIHTKTNAEFLKTEKNGDWWISCIDSACKKGMLFALLTGGECLLHPDFQRIYLHLRKNGVYTRINTNGLLLTQNIIDFLKQNPPFEIQLTMYGADDNGYEKVTGVRVFEQINQTIHRVLDAGLNLRVSLTPNAFAPGETERIIAYLKARKVNYSINETMFTSYDSNEKQRMSDNEVSIEEKISYFRAHGAVHTPVPEDELPPVGGNCIEAIKGIRCTAGRVSFAISHDGCMMPCTAMYHLRIRLESGADFENCWNRMLDISDNFLQPIECEGCAYKKACLSCAILRGGKVGNGHCDPEVCEMTRRLVAAGVKKLEK